MRIIDGYGMMRGGYWILWVIYILVLIGVILLIRYLHERWATKATKIEPKSALEGLKK